MEIEMTRRYALIGGILAVVGSSFNKASGASSSHSSTSTNIAILNRYWRELLNKGDLSKYHEIISSDFTLYVGGKPDPLKGIALFRAMAEGQPKSFSKMEMIQDEIIADGNIIALRWHGDAVHDKGVYRGFEVIPNDVQITFHGMTFYRFNANGLITEGRIFSNMFEILQLRKQRAEGKPDQLTIK